MELKGISTDGLRNLNSQIVAELRQRSVQKQQDLMRAIKIGDNVTFAGRNGVGIITARVQRMNLKTITAAEVRNGIVNQRAVWRVSPSLCTLVPKPTS